MNNNPVTTSNNSSRVRGVVGKEDGKQEEDWIRVKKRGHFMSTLNEGLECKDHEIQTSSSNQR